MSSAQHAASSKPLNGIPNGGHTAVPHGTMASTSLLHPNHSSITTPQSHPAPLPIASNNGQMQLSLRSRRPREVPDPSEWRHYSSMAIKLLRVPNDVTTWDIYHSLRPKVDILWIELFENLRGERNGTARVRMVPPNRNHWQEGHLVIEKSNGDNSKPPNRKCLKVGVQIEAFSFTEADEQITSPLGKPVPAKMGFKAARLQFGIMHQKSAMMTMKDIEPQGANEILMVAVDFSRRRFNVHFSLRLKDTNSKEDIGRVYYYRMEIKFSRLKQLFRQQLGSGRAAIVISLEHPPLFFRKVTDVEMTHSSDRLSWGESDLWHRQTNIMYDPRQMRDAVVAFNKDGQFVDIGRWTTYRLELAGDVVQVWSNVERHISDFNIKTKLNAGFDIVTGKSSSMWDILDAPSHAISSPKAALALLGNAGHVALPFGVRYQLEVCLSQRVLDEQNVDAAFLQTLASLPEHKAESILELVAERGTRVYNPSDIFTDPNATTYFRQRDFKELPGYCVVARKAIVTPSKIYFTTPAVETNNRVLREYKTFSDRFLRVQFTDELPEGRINPCADVTKNDELFTRIFRCLVNGIRIGDRHYELLAFGNSQLRENGAYFFAPTDHLTCDDIRRWMGDFSTIKSVAKYAARLGQCFSTTRLIPGFSVPKVVKIPDVERNGYCFTDGVGKISQLWAQLISGHLKKPSVSSAFQFRMGGCKGILVVWPDARKGEVHVRPSQEKFQKAIFNGLEVIRCSDFRSASLNQQTILILSSLGVPDEVFLDLLAKELGGINSAMNDKKKAVSELSKRIDENQMTIFIARMVLNGFMDANEPFVWTLLQLWRSWSLKALKEKAKIQVEDGAFVLGCVDETGTLRGHSRETEKDGHKRRNRRLLPQIFLQVPENHADKTNDSYKILTGLCLVGRNPSLHPGDIRVVEAVDVPELRHLKDVVVFPQRGDRDVPGMCSGGDLDGDDFFVFWNKDLLPPESEWNYPPMDFTAPPARTVEGDVTLLDLSRFFVVYMKNNSLSSIALAHRAQADRLDTHAKHPNCLELAQLHSKAVDYVKSGTAAEMRKKLAPGEWPHWMEKRYKRQYHSHQVLGQIYDKVKTVDFQPAYDKPFDERILKRYKLDDSLLQKARKIKTQYDTAMKRLMGHKEIGTEFEVWTSFILSRPSVGSDYKLSEDMGRESSALKERFREICIKEAGGLRDFGTLGPFVAAMYKVTQEEVLIALHECGRLNISSNGQQYRRRTDAKLMPLISFPWLFDRELGRIATGSEFQPDITEYADIPSRNNSDPAKIIRVGELDSGDLEEMQYVCTADGLVTHRGEPLALLGHDYDDEDDGWEVIEPDTSQESHGEISSRNTTPVESRNSPTVGDSDRAETCRIDSPTPLNSPITTLSSPPAALDDDEDEFSGEDEIVMIPDEENALMTAARLFGGE